MIHPSDQEQIQIIKNWFRENGLFTITTIILVLIVSYGWRFWQEQQVKKTTQASLVYEQLLNNIAGNQFEELQQNVTTLITKYSHTPYASLAELMAAKIAVQNNKMDDAVTKLQWVIQHSKNDDLKQLARIRKARILLFQNNPQQALVALDKIENEGYLPMIHEVRGDIYLALDDKEKAKTAYQHALNLLSKTDPHYAFLQIKFDQLKL